MVSTREECDRKKEVGQKEGKDTQENSSVRKDGRFEEGGYS